MMISRRRLLVSVSLCALAAACGRTQGAAPPSPGSQSRALPVKAAPVQLRDVTFAITAIGSLEAEEIVQVTAEVDGALSAVRFHEGDRVGPETVLVLIDPDRYRLEFERAEANYRKALADESRAKADFERRELLAQQQLISAEELNRLRQESEGLIAQAAAAKAARDIAQQNLARAEVRARHTGVINSRQADPGQFVKAGTVLATLVDTSRLRLRFKISEGESLRTRLGQTLQFHVAALGERAFEAQIYHVGEVADPTTRQVEVLAWVRNPGVLKGGFFAEVMLATDKRKDALIVPETAVQASERGFVVYVVEDAKARQRSVRLGLRTPEHGVEILSGLKSGEVVVYEGSDRLADGLAVRTAEGPGGPQPEAGSPAGDKPPAPKAEESAR